MEPPLLRELNLAQIADEIDAPYRLVPLVSLGGIEMAVFICEGPKTWHRVAEHDEALLVLEGVITLEGKGGKTVVEEGEMARIPAKVGLNYFSGMRSTVILTQEQAGASWGSNGYHAPSEEDHSIGKRNYAGEVRQAPLFHWERLGVTGGYALSASRLQGDSRPYRVPPGSVVALVYRGVLDYVGPTSTGSIVGSQILVMPGDTTVVLRSERGATVVVLARKGAPLPGPAS